MNTATATNRFRGRAGRRLAAALVAAAALGLGATACGPDSGAAAPAGSPAPPDAQHASNQAADNSGAQGQNGGKTAPSAARGATSGGGGHTGHTSAPAGGGVAHAGNHRTFVGKLEYLAPGKLIVKPEGGGMDQAFYVANDTRILGAAAICSIDDGRVTIGKDGYGTSKCTEEQLEKAAKTSSVTVRVTMDRKSGAAETVEEKYHP
ncbi:hypothetical protein [Streptomyces sp. WZ-12]|uniref:hypothetical protein n=1 Tax=Streptomyces sp. WZ-12 TaxID=3030210 RepID=UPI00238134AD|nr:hypothetical protein [Streptomyces sp. WZ-12]